METEVQGEGGMAQEEEPPGMYVYISVFVDNTRACLYVTCCRAARTVGSNPHPSPNTPIYQLNANANSTAVDEDGWTTVRTTRRRNPPRRNTGQQQQPRLFG